MKLPTAKSIAALAALSIVGLSGCVPVARVTLFNGLREPVTIVTCAGSQIIEPEQLAILNGSGCSYSEEPQVKIAASTTTWEYRNFLWYALWLFRDNEDFTSRKFPSGYDVLAQLQSDGTILILRPGTTTPSVDTNVAIKVRPSSVVEG